MTHAAREGTSADDCLSTWRISRFVRGEASAEELRAFDQHQDVCDVCRRAVATALKSPLTAPPGALASARPATYVFEHATLAAAASIDPVTEEERSMLQARLALFALVLGAVSAIAIPLALVVKAAIDAAHWRAYATAPHQAASAAIAALLLAGGYATRTSRRGARFSTLLAADAIGTLVATALVSVNSAFEQPGQAAALTVALSAGFLSTLRAVIVPSSGRRTLVLGAAASAVALAAEAIHATLAPSPSTVLSHQVGVTALWLALLTGGATVGSSVIFGLRREAVRLRVAGQYLLERKVGEGSMGEVFEARHTLLRRRAAIKLLSRSSRPDAARIARFEREAQLTAQLRHPNTVAVYDFGQTQAGVLYYAMEYLEGLTLEELVAREGHLPAGRVAHILDQVLASLEEAHARNLVHRDIKPANVMIEGGVVADAVKVLDFGLVHEVPSGDDGARGTAPLAGTPAYMAPECYAPGYVPHPASDVYSVAAVGYFLLTGSAVFDASSLRDMRRLHQTARPEPPAARLGHPVAPDLAELLLAGLAKDPGARPASAAAFREALAACSKSEAWSQSTARAWWASRRAADTFRV
jgi:serine/threonine-protein kinase